MLKVDIVKEISSLKHNMLLVNSWLVIVNSSQNAESNAEYKGLDADHLIIEHIQVPHWKISFLEYMFKC